MLRRPHGGYVPAYPQPSQLVAPIGALLCLPLPCRCTASPMPHSCLRCQFSREIVRLVEIGNERRVNPVPSQLLAKAKGTGSRKADHDEPSGFVQTPLCQRRVEAFPFAKLVQLRLVLPQTASAPSLFAGYAPR